MISGQEGASVRQVTGSECHPVVSTGTRVSYQPHSTIVRVSGRVLWRIGAKECRRNHTMKRISHRRFIRGVGKGENGP